MTVSHSSVGRGVIWSVLNSGLGQLLSLGIFFVTARFVSAADFGVMAICLLTIDLFRNVALEGFATAVSTRAKPTDEDFDTCFVAILCLSAVSAVLAIILAEFVARLMHNDHMAGVIRLMSILLLTIGLSRTHEAWMARQLQFKLLALRSIVSLVVGGAVGITLAVNGFGIVSLIAQQLVTAVVATIALWMTCAWKPKLRVNRESLSTLWTYSRHVSLTGLTNFANTQSDTFFASYYLGASATGIYNAAKRVLQGINMVVATALNRVALPTFANLRSDPARMKSSYLSAISFTSTITAPIFAGLIVVSADAILIMMGPRWSEVAPIISIISITAYTSTIGQYNHSIMLVHDKPHWQTTLTAIYAISNVALFALVVRYGLLALAIGFTVRAIVLFPLSIGAALYLLRVKPMEYLRQVMPTFLSAAAMGLLVWLFRREVVIDNVFLRLAASIVVGSAAYAAALSIFARRDLLALLNFSRRVAARA